MDYRHTLHAIPPHHPSYTSKNCLIVKDDVGRSKPSCRDLPNDNYSYGAPNNPDKEGVCELITHWTFHQSVTRPHDKIQDFRRLNKLAIRNGIHDARDQTIQRLSRKDITVQPVRFVNPATKSPFDHNSGHIYGRPPRPSSPMDRVLSHDYGREGQEKTAQAYELYTNMRAEAARPMKVKLTQAARGHAIRAVHRRSLDGHNAVRGTIELNSGEQPFKMKKFSKVGPRTNTFLMNEVYSASHPRSGLVLTKTEMERSRENGPLAENNSGEAIEEEVYAMDA